MSKKHYFNNDNHDKGHLGWKRHRMIMSVDPIQRMEKDVTG